jgi:hypothetical protein
VNHLDARSLPYEPFLECPCEPERSNLVILEVLAFFLYFLNFSKVMAIFWVHK